MPFLKALKWVCPSSTDGVVKVDPSGLNGRKGISISITTNVDHHKTLVYASRLQSVFFLFVVFVYLACAFRYGSDDLDVMGLSFRRDIWIQRVQVYPPPDGNKALSPMQDFLMKKVGEQGCPFSFQVRLQLPLYCTSPPDKYTTSVNSNT